MKIYECYKSPSDKRKAQRKGAKRGRPTGLATDYILVFDEDGRDWHGASFCYNCAISELMAIDEPEDLPHTLITSTPGVDYIAECCRIVGFDYIPERWKKAFAHKLDNILDESIPELADQRKRYRKILRLAEG